MLSTMSTPNTGYSSTVNYTWNQGAEWSSCRYIDTPLQVSVVYANQRQASQSFLLFGQRPISNATNSPLSPNGVIVYVGFRGVHQRECAKATEPLAADSDYEVFSPADTNNSFCLMGQSSSYVRRRRLSQCYGMFPLMHITFRANVSV